MKYRKSENCCILEKSRKKLVKIKQKKFSKILANLQNFVSKFQQFLTQKLRLENGCCLMASHFHLFGVVLARFFPPSFRLWIPKTVQRSAMCRSRRELSNAYFLAKFGLDTAENEPCQVCPIPRFHAAASCEGQADRGVLHLTHHCVHGTLEVVPDTSRNVFQLFFSR